MKIAIHKNGNFAKRWIAYCDVNDIEYKVVNCYSNNIIEELQDCDILMWHFSQSDPKDYLCARQILYAVQEMHKKVFPDFKTMWHFDDKIGQKYLLEAVQAPLVPTYVFYSKYEAINWAKRTSYPKVFKLRKGAGSYNVKLVKTEKQALRKIRRSFGRGYSQYNKWGNITERIYKYKQGNMSLFDLLKGFIRMFYTTRFAKVAGNERGYVYFQEYIPDNQTDFRIKVVADRCWGFQREVRKGDFRASGSDKLIFDNTKIPKDMIQIAFSIYHRLNLQSVAFDFILNRDQPYVVEMSYAFGFDEREMDNGYWTKDLIFHTEKFNPYGWMIENLIQS